MLDCISFSFASGYCTVVVIYFFYRCIIFISALLFLLIVIIVIVISVDDIVGLATHYNQIPTDIKFG